MKWVVLALVVIIALLSGILVYSFEAGHPPFKKAGTESVTEAPEQPVEMPDLLANPQSGMIQELLTALQSSRQEITEARQELDKREKNLQELHAAYLKLRQVVEDLQKDLETQLIRVDESQNKNFKTLAGVYAKMDPVSAARALQHMDAERVALILSRMDSRSMAAVMDSAVSSSSDGGEAVALWSDAIRRLSEMTGEDGL